MYAQQLQIFSCSSLDPLQCVKSIASHKSSLVRVDHSVYFDPFSLLSFQRKQQQKILVYLLSQHITLSEFPLPFPLFSQTSSCWSISWLSLWCLFFFFYFHSIPFILSLMTLNLHLLYHNNSQMYIST